MWSLTAPRRNSSRTIFGTITVFDIGVRYLDCAFDKCRLHRIRPREPGSRCGRLLRAGDRHRAWLDHRRSDGGPGARLRDHGFLAPMTFEEAPKPVLVAPIAAVTLFGLLGMDGLLSRGDGVILLVGYVIALAYVGETFRQ